MNIEIADEQYADKINILQALYNVKDPELNINIVDLGLVYDITVNNEKKLVIVEMTLSTPSCPLGNIITHYAKLAIESAMTGYEACIELVWEPRWSYNNITPEGKQALGL